VVGYLYPSTWSVVLPEVATVSAALPPDSDPGLPLVRTPLIGRKRELAAALAVRDGLA
jgi:hypothetical protein